MVESQTRSSEKRLRESVSRFLYQTAVTQCPMNAVLETIKNNNWTAFLCGGVLRDLLFGKNGSSSRDIDIIVQSLEKKKLLEAFSRFTCKENRFGGLSVQILNCKADVWTLDSTWALKNNHVKYNSCFSDYTKTTFLNIEAIAVELFPKRGIERKIYSNGFFESIDNRVLEINLEANPDPEVNIARAIYMSFKYEFSLGTKLSEYIVKHAKEINKDRLSEIYKNTYMLGCFDVRHLNEVFERVEKGISVRNHICATREAQCNLF